MRPAVFSFGAVQPIYDLESLEWSRPVTDQEWDEDIKKEQLDIRSDSVLDEMLARHTEKLARVGEAFSKWQDCPECIKYDMRESILTREENKNLNKAQLDKLVDDEFTYQYEKEKEDYERLLRAVERMQKEKEFRLQGKVTRIKTID